MGGSVRSRNRHPTGTAEMTMDMAGFSPGAVEMHKAMQRHDLRATDPAQAPDAVVPADRRDEAVEDGRLRGRSAPLFYHVFRIPVT